jgi:molybdopterin synthase catalytic subunit
MTEKASRSHRRRGARRWDFYGVRVIHRVGRLLPGDRIVFVAVVGAHRGEAFAACEFIMDYLKTRAPFWKKGSDAGGRALGRCARSDDHAATRWQK